MLFIIIYSPVLMAMVKWLNSVNSPLPFLSLLSKRERRRAEGRWVYTI
jgi:hypothetical protein